jgi:hypothetical protein
VSLRAIRSRVAGYLVEAMAAVSVDVVKYLQDLKDYVWSVADYSNEELRKFKAGDPDAVAHAKRTYEPEGYSEKQVREDVSRLARETKRNMEVVARTVAAAVGRVDGWSGTKIVVRPSYSIKRDRWGVEMNPGEACTDAKVDFVEGRNAPSFTLFSDGTVDDVLDAGDRDFFTDPAVEADYFALVGELRSPGSTAKAGKVITLYTARPRKDRDLYDGAKVVPHGIFLTNDEDRAYRLGMDLGGDRDVYRVRIDSRHLVKTLEAGGVREYQAVGRGTVPVVSIDLVA